MPDNKDGTQHAGDITVDDVDPIDLAITDTDGHQPDSVGSQVIIQSTGRPAQVIIPAGITVAEMAELVNWMWMALYPASQKAAAGAVRPMAILDTPRGPVAVKRN